VLKERSTQARLALLKIVREVRPLGHAARVAVAIVGDCATNAGDCAHCLVFRFTLDVSIMGCLEPYARRRLRVFVGRCFSQLLRGLVLYSSGVGTASTRVSTWHIAFRQQECVAVAFEPLLLASSAFLHWSAARAS